MKRAALFLIKCYQAVSSVLPPRCRFQPSCSSYAYQAIEIYGFFKGSFMAFKRIIRCHPFCKGGIDPVPKRQLTINNGRLIIKDNDKKNQ